MTVMRVADTVLDGPGAPDSAETAIASGNGPVAGSGRVAHGGLDDTGPVGAGLTRGPTNSGANEPGVADGLDRIRGAARCRRSRRPESRLRLLCQHLPPLAHISLRIWPLMVPEQLGNQEASSWLEKNT